MFCLVPSFDFIFFTMLMSKHIPCFSILLFCILCWTKVYYFPLFGFLVDNFILDHTRHSSTWHLVFLWLRRHSRLHLLWASTGLFECSSAVNLSTSVCTSSKLMLSLKVSRFSPLLLMNNPGFWRTVTSGSVLLLLLTWTMNFMLISKATAQCTKLCDKCHGIHVFQIS